MSTTTTASQDVAAHLENLLRLISTGKAHEAFHTYYAQDVVMGENEHPPTVGFTANLEREQAAWACIARFDEFTVLSSGAGGDHSFYESIGRWVDTEGRPHRIRQVAIARWRDGRIVDERFVYDTASVA